MDGHVLGQIGLHASEPGDPCGPGLHLHLSEMLLEPDGHLDFGVLGVFLDLACSMAPGIGGPFVHADISVHRIARPQGQKVFVDARTLRRGKRTSIVQVEAFDDLGVRVADSTQQVVVVGPRRDGPTDDEHMTAMRRRFMSRLDGRCTLTERLHDIIGLSRQTAADGSPFWTMPISDSSRNGLGGLHGGVAFDLVTEAAVGGAAESVGPVRANGALLRYLAPATVGPFRAEPTVMVEDDGAVFAASTCTTRATPTCCASSARCTPRCCGEAPTGGGHRDARRSARARRHVVRAVARGRRRARTARRPAPTG